MPNNASGDDVAAEAPPSWRELAVARSLDSARTRAENRVQRFLDAALELMDSGDSKEFTVQEVVERSGQSLRSFYQYFGGKHELLLALFEESVRSTAVVLREKVDEETDPLDRLHRFVVEYYRMCSPAPKGKSKKASPPPLMVEFAQQLLTAHPAEAARAFVPLVSLFEEIVKAAAEAGAIKGDLPHRAVVGTMLAVIMFNSFSATIAATPVQDATSAAEELWAVVLNGIATR